MDADESLQARFREFYAKGGMWGIEREAARQAIAEQRRSWLPVLEAWADLYPADIEKQVHNDIRRLRRLLRLSPVTGPEAADRRREQTRERVRRYRERRGTSMTWDRADFDGYCRLNGENPTLPLFDEQYAGLVEYER